MWAATSVYRNLLSLVLKRFLGRFLLDHGAAQGAAAQVDTDLRNGRLSLTGLAIDPRAIAAHLPLDTLTIEAATLQSVTITISTPLTWSSAINVRVTGLRLDCLTRPRREPHIASSSSVIHAVTESLLDEEGGDAILQESIAELTQSERPAMPGDFSRSEHPASRSGPPNRTMLAQFIEGVVRRINVDVEGVQVRLTDLEAGLELDCDIQQCRLLQTAAPETARMLQIAGVEVWCGSERQASSSFADSASTSPSSIASGESTYDMAMSRAVLDVRASVADVRQAQTERQRGDELERYKMLHADDVSPIEICMPLSGEQAGADGNDAPSASIDIPSLLLRLSPPHLIALHRMITSLFPPCSRSAGAGEATAPHMPLDIKLGRCDLTYGDSAKEDSLHLSIERTRLLTSTSAAASMSIDVVELALARSDTKLPLMSLTSARGAAQASRSALALAISPTKVDCSLGIITLLADFSHLGRSVTLASLIADALTTLSSPSSQNSEKAKRALDIDIAVDTLALRLRVPPPLPSSHLADIVLQLERGHAQLKRDATKAHIGIARFTGALESAQESRRQVFLDLAQATTASIDLAARSSHHESSRGRCTGKLTLQKADVQLDKSVLDELQTYIDGTTKVLASLADARPPRIDPEGGASNSCSLRLSSTVQAIAVRLAVPSALGDRQVNVVVRGCNIGVKFRDDATYHASLVVNDVNLSHKAPKRDTEMLLERMPVLADRPFLTVIASSPASPAPARAPLQVQLVAARAQLPADDTLIIDLARFAQSPPGVFDTVVPAIKTDIDISCEDVLVQAATKAQDVAACLLLESITARIVTRHDIGESDAQIDARSAMLFLRDMAFKADVTLHGPNGRAVDLLSSGHAEILRAHDVRVSGTYRVQSSPSARVRMLGGQFRLSACADSLEALTRIGGSDQAAEVHDEALPIPAPPIPSISSGVELAGFTLSHSVLSSALTDRTQPQERVPAAARHLPRKREGLHIVDDYLASKSARPSQSSVAPPLNIDVSIEGCSVQVLLYAGFDLENTRERIRRDIKTVRRRLLRIRQTIADGQTPDETAAEASAGLRESLFLPLPGGGIDVEADEVLEALEAEYAKTSRRNEDDWQEVRAGASPSRSPQPAALAPFRSTLARAPSHALRLDLSGVTIGAEAYQSGADRQSRLNVVASALEIVDNLPTSTWNKFLTEMRVGDGGVARPTGAPMLRIEVTQSLSSGTQAGRKEVNVRFKISPLRLYADQDVLEFLKTFFAPRSPTVPSASDAEQAFVARFEAMPIRIKLDYKPKRVDYHALRHGRTIELMNFFNFEGSEMTLRHIVLSGIYGWDRLSTLLQDVWTPDVKANQLADFLAGLSPVRSLVNVGNGVADLVLLPIEQYRKHGQLGRGLQRGFTSFSRAAAQEAMRLTARLATGTQVVLEQAETVLGGNFGSSTAARVVAGAETDVRPSKYASQPADLRQGIATAAQGASSNMRSAAQTIFAVPLEVYERSSEGSIRAVVRAAPIAVLLRPAIGATEATRNVLFGAVNQIQPTVGLEDKYKR